MPKHYHTCLLMNALLALRPCLVSHQCRCVLQRLSVADFKRPCLKPLGVQLRASMPLYERSVGFASCKAFGRSTSSIHARPRKRVRFCCSVKPSQLCGDVNALVVFMVVLLSIPIPSHRTTPSKTALSHSLFVGRGAYPSRNITAIIKNKLIEL